MDVAAIAVDDVLAVMNQPMNGGTFWLTMNPTASRLRGRIEAVLSYAKARGWRDGPNPALWRDGLEHVLAAPDEVHQTIRHRALDWRQAPAFVATLRQSPRIRARMAEFVMLTWTRSTPVLEMRWGQIDVERCIWIVPRENEKTGKPHRVPLCDRAMELVLAMRPADVEPDDVVFHSPVEYGGRKAVRGKNTMLHEVSDYTSVHGLRATVKQWSKATGQSRELTEEALSHLYEGKVEKAYSRDEDQLEQRRPLMQKWSEFLDSAEIIDLAMRRVA
jgi:integrase